MKGNSMVDILIVEDNKIILELSDENRREIRNINKELENNS